MTDLSTLRRQIRDLTRAPEAQVIDALRAQSAPSPALREEITARARDLVQEIRGDDRPGLMEVFLTEYGLSTSEGIALMCLAEALLRVPDAETIDELIDDKIAPSSWGEHLGKSSSSLVNASTWALMLTGKVLDDDRSRGMAHILHSAVKRLGEPVIRTAVRAAMREMGNQFVLGETIESAIKRGRGMEANGYTYSYDMLGEAALTARDAAKFHASYAHAIRTLGARATSADIRDNPGISIKLSALHPRYEVGQRDRVMAELVDSALDLALLAKEHNMGLNIDAEEADRLDLSLDVIEAVLSDDRLAGWDGFGVVVQAYGKRAAPVLDWLHAVASKHDRRIMVRLVKGAYWDTEIKRSQVEGLPGFPVFTRKTATDVSYICCAARLFAMTDRIYPQFATHNAHTVAAIRAMAPDTDCFEFQRLHGMGEVLHRRVKKAEGTRCRIYAPVGAHRDLLAYLVRRLLENGANSSFVNQIVDEDVPPAVVAADPFAAWEAEKDQPQPHITAPEALFAPERTNSRGWDLHDTTDLAEIETARAPFARHQWTATPLLAVEATGGAPQPLINPADPSDIVGHVAETTAEEIASAQAAATDWSIATGAERARTLSRAADLYEAHFGEIFAILTREAGKTPRDAIAELREAVDFLRYYATRIGGLQHDARGVFTCISPWNFPLAIFTGQIAAALAAGNGVLAKPADATPLIAHRAVSLLHEAGVPRAVLQLLPGTGAQVGAPLVETPDLAGVCFTGSTATAQGINRALATSAPTAPLIAETGGLNAMIVDSTALPEQAIRDIVISSFQSAGQRCSALRLLYLQEDIAPAFLEMLYGAMEELALGDPWDLATDIGPVIDARAQAGIAEHVAQAQAEGRVMKTVAAPDTGHFIAPTVIRVAGMADLEREIFGPVLHVATFRASQLDQVIDAVNTSGYGLTFGLHTRIDDRVEHVANRVRVGNLYVNRNQIGAIVGSQPFGGEGLSGTGPKAGGPNYVPRFTALPRADAEDAGDGGDVAELDATAVQQALDALPRPCTAPLEVTDLPGPTGESNRLSLFPRGVVLCLGPDLDNATRQAQAAQARGCATLTLCPGATGAGCLDRRLSPEVLKDLTGFDAVALAGTADSLRPWRQALAAGTGALLPLLDEADIGPRCVLERHVCIDTTASGGNAVLLAGADPAPADGHAA
ncbi:bifunctional proline dehydrogenase/L-glutamate gamma-semialdehyde dehydrogenase PutA [Pseudooceanicola aestuarii]|uniref:bifunctional proline dehydrogenase/L-glutamate gamma-semialdehyde dehydrogenase PutA n=1 Tax=Pseudooceanicola aestuarii TaxID=2697319 RepID=UPI0013D42C06|nr:bifunctional proline dehydrogenase/L-glutamate gamma-semialdehyde dehydrogenase PutA [Pseudooceanicola aestuarii]